MTALCRRSEWGHTKIFSDFDEETSDGDDVDAETSFGHRSILSSKLKSKVASSRSVFCVLQSISQYRVYEEILCTSV